MYFYRNFFFSLIINKLFVVVLVIKSFNLRLILSTILFVRPQIRSFQSFLISPFCTNFHFSAHNIWQESHLKKSQAMEFFLLLFGQVLQFNCEQRLLFTVNKNCSVSIHDLEKVNEFLPMNPHFEIISNKVEVTCYHHLSGLRTHAPKIFPSTDFFRLAKQKSNDLLLPK